MNEQNNNIINEIKKIHDKYNKKPLLLSTLGVEFKKSGIATPKEGIKNFIQDNMQEYCFINTKEHNLPKEKILLILKEEECNISNQIEEANIKNFYRSFVKAFTEKNEASSFLEMKPPYKYFFDKPHNFQKCENYKEIKPSYKINKEFNGDSKKLYETIEKWCEDNKLDINMFKFSHKANHKTNEKNYFLDENIQNFINSQPDNIKKQLLIPYSFLKR